MKTIFIISNYIRRFGKLLGIRFLANLTHSLSRWLVRRSLNGIDFSSYDIKYTPCEVPNVIWIFWYQGEESLPPVGQSCLQKLKENIPDNFIINIVSKENIHLFFDIPEHISKRLNSGDMSITHFSDLLRFYLLYRFGGVWIDSTVLISKQLQAEFFSGSFLTLKHTDFSIFDSVTEGKWTTYFIGSYKGNILSKFIYDSLIHYWSVNNKIIDYFYLDYLISVAYNDVPSIKELIDSQVAYIGEKRWLVYRLYDKEINDGDNDNISLDNVGIYKLSYKLKPPKSKSTYYYKYFC